MKTFTFKFLRHIEYQLPKLFLTKCPAFFVCITHCRCSIELMSVKDKFFSFSFFLFSKSRLLCSKEPIQQKEATSVCWFPSFHSIQLSKGKTISYEKSHFEIQHILRQRGSKELFELYIIVLEKILSTFLGHQNLYYTKRFFYKQTLTRRC